MKLGIIGAMAVEIEALKENMENMNINAPALLFPTDGYTFDTHTDIQNGFIEKVTDEGIDEALVWLEGVKNDTEQSHPEALVHGLQYAQSPRSASQCRSALWCPRSPHK